MGVSSAIKRRGMLRQAVFLAWACSAPRAVAAASKLAPLTLGIFPYLPALHIGRKYGVLAIAFAELCERPINLRTKSSFPEFRRLLLEGRYDIALLHPFLYVDVMGVQDYRPLARLRDDLTAVIVAHEGRQLERLADLRGLTLAVPPRLSAVAVLVQQELVRAGLAGPDGVQLSFHRTKAACLHAIARDTAAACAVPGFALDQLEQFRPIALAPKFQTGRMPGPLLVAHGRLGDRHLAALRRAVLSWGDDPPSRQLLQALGWSGLLAVQPGDYARDSLVGRSQE